MEVNGTFDVKRFYETLALILSQKENMEITVTVHEDTEETDVAKVQRAI